MTRLGKAVINNDGIGPHNCACLRGQMSPLLNCADERVVRPATMIAAKSTCSEHWPLRVLAPTSVATTAVGPLAALSPRSRQGLREFALEALGVAEPTADAVEPGVELHCDISPNQGAAPDAKQLAHSASRGSSTIAQC